MKAVRRADSLTGRLRDAFAVLILLVTTAGLAGALALDASASRVERSSTVLTPAVETNATVLQLMLDAQTALQGYLLTGERSLLEPYQHSRGRVAEELSRLEDLAAEAGSDADVDRLRALAAAWLDGYADPLVSSAGTGAGRPGDYHGAVAFDAFRAEHEKVATVLAAEREQLRAESRLLRSVGVPALLGLTVVCVTVATVTARGGVRTVENPMVELRQVLERLRMGEHSARASTQGPREVRQVAMAANALADESDRLRTEQQEAARLRQASREASRQVREKLDRESVMQTAAQALAGILDVDRVWIGEVVGDAERLDVRPGTPDGAKAQWQREGLLPVPPVPGTDDGILALVRRMAQQGDVLVVPNTLVSDLFRSEQGRMLREVAPDAGAVVVAPVEGSDDLIGIAVLVALEPREVTTGEVSAVQSVCADLGRALEHSRLFEQQLELVDRLQELDRQKTDFLSTVSHELRTPLTSIAGYAELLRDGDAGPVTEQMSSMLEVIERNTGRLRSLIEDLLTLSRIESGAYRSTLTDVDLSAVVRSAVTSLRPQAASGGLEVRVDLPAAPAVVAGDEMQLERAVLNLLSNAVKFTPPGGTVALSVERTASPEGPVAVVRVRDSGIGIPVADQERLFTRFFRASNAVERAVPGTGLGLSIVRGIVSHHGGTLVLRSARDEGTEVELVLPLVRESLPVG